MLEYMCVRGMERQRGTWLRVDYLLVANMPLPVNNSSSRGGNRTDVSDNDTSCRSRRKREAREEASSAGGAVSATQVNKVTNKHDGKSLT